MLAPSFTVPRRNIVSVLKSNVERSSADAIYMPPSDLYYAYANHQCHAHYAVIEWGARGFRQNVDT